MLEHNPTSPSERLQREEGHNWDTERPLIIERYTTFLSENNSSANMDEQIELDINAPQQSDLDLPIALRRRKRRCSSIIDGQASGQLNETLAQAADAQAGTDVHDNDDSNTILSAASTKTTPSKPRNKKRVRFSDPSYLTTSTNSTTGLTPYLHRTKLATTPSRRHSAPGTSVTVNGTPHPSLLADSNITEIQFTPLRQVLDERCKRRIRRNGLSEEVNAFEADRREKERLRKEIESKDRELVEIRKEMEKNVMGDERTAQGDSGVQGSRRSIDEVEEELRKLRESFQHEEEDEDVDMVPDSITVVDTIAAAIPTSAQANGIDDNSDGDTIPIFEDDDAMTERLSFESAATNQRPPHLTTRSAHHDASTSANLPDLRQDAEMLAIALDLEVAKQEKRDLFKEWRAAFPSMGSTSTSTSNNGFNFNDTPSSSQRAAAATSTSTRSPPSPPPNFLHQLSSKLRATTSRAEEAELSFCALETDLRTLGFLSSSDNDSHAIITELKRQFRLARLELERAVPGETTFGFKETEKVIPELVFRLGKLVRQIRDREAELRSMNEQQRTLKGNFEHALLTVEKAGTRVRELEQTVEEISEELIGQRMRCQEFEHEGKEKDKTITSLVNALERYREDVRRLEELVMRMESEEPFRILASKEEVRGEMEKEVAGFEDKFKSEESKRMEAEQAVETLRRRLRELESGFEATTRQAMELGSQLSSLTALKAEEEFKLKKRLHESSEQHDVQLGTLSTRISNLSTELEEANLEVEKLHAVKERLEIRVKREMEQGAAAVEAMQHELIRGLAKVNESRKSYIRSAKVRGANEEIEDELEGLVRGSSEPASELSSAGPMTPRGMVRFVDVEESVEGEVEIGRGKKGRGGRRRRGYDSGVGMMSDGDSIDQDEDLEGEVEIVES